MKALSVREPWASMLIDGGKTIEVRSWSTDYRGELLICASASPKDFFWHHEAANVDRLLPAGCILGIVNLIDVRKMTPKDNRASIGSYIPGAYAWVVETVCSCRPDKIIGKLRLFDVPDEKVVRLEPGDWWANYPPPQGQVKRTKNSPYIG